MAKRSENPLVDDLPISELAEKVLALLEAAGIDTATNDKVVELVERGERQANRIEQIRDENPDHLIRDENPDHLSGMEWARGIFHAYFALCDLPCRVGWHSWELWFPYWGGMSNHYRCRRCGVLRSWSAPP